MQRVLIVDDDRLVADTLSLVFRVNGFEAQASYSASEGLEQARSFQPALLLTDITMPERTGIDLASDIRRELPACKVLMLTAYSSNLDRLMEHIGNGNEPFPVLRKPVRPEELLREAGLLLQQAS